MPLAYYQYVRFLCLIKAPTLTVLNICVNKVNTNKKRGENMNGKSDNECLNEFEGLNNTCDSIYNLGDHKVLILLKDGTNLTSWNEVENREDIIYISEDLSGVTDLSFRYQGLKSLKGIVAFGVSNKVKSMEYMFEDCHDLEDISSLAGWDVSSVTNMEYMFNYCHHLEDISSLKGWDVSGVTNMGFMFGDSSGLSGLSALANGTFLV